MTPTKLDILTEVLICLCMLRFLYKDTRYYVNRVLRKINRLLYRTFKRPVK